MSDLSAYLATPAAFDFLARWPREVRDRHCRETVSAAADMLAEAWGVRVPTDPRLQAPYMRVVPFPGERRFTTEEENAAIVTARQRFRAEIAVTSPGGISGVRLSAFLYNEVADYECLRDLPALLPR